MLTLLHKPEDYMLPCLSKKLLGTECMGCGLQRSFVMVMQGEFTSAFQMYPAIYTLILLFTIVGINIVKPSKLLGKLIVILAITNVVVIVGSFLIKQYIN